jgi:hypothetical protein
MSTLHEAQACIPDQAAADDFGHRMVDVMNDVAVAVLVSIGHQPSCLMYSQHSRLRPAQRLPTMQALMKDTPGMVGRPCICRSHYLRSAIASVCPIMRPSLTRAGGVKNISKIAAD